jgi:hypothetical protein
MLASEVACNQDTFDQSGKREVEDFFSNLFSREFGYTLIGAKPISEDEFEGKYYQEVGFFQEIDENCFCELRKIFDKSSNFVLKILCDGPCYSIELINRRAVRELVQQNRVLQEFIKKRFKSIDDFYSQIEDRNRSIFRVLRNNDRIIGYLLGYDETNIEYYIRRIEVGNFLQKYPFVHYHPLPGGIYSNNPFIFLNPHLYYKRLQPNHGFDSLESEWRWIKQVEWDIGKECNPVPPYFIYLPFYICRHGGDSELTREKFKKASGNVAELFCNMSFKNAVAELAVKEDETP